MTDDWEEFEGRPSVRKTDRPRVTLNRNGVFLFNNLAVDALGKPDAVVFYFDRRRERIGIKASDPGIDNAFPLHRNEKNYLNRVSGRAFCRHHRIKLDSTIAFDEIDTDDSGLMILELEKAAVVAI